MATNRGNCYHSLQLDHLRPLLDDQARAATAIEIPGSDMRHAHKARARSCIG